MVTVSGVDYQILNSNICFNKHIYIQIYVQY